MVRHLSWLGAAVVLAACNSDKAPAPAPVASASAAVVVADADAGAPPSGGPTLANKWTKAQGFRSPESVVHDEKSDLYYISNVDGKPLEADGKGFISKAAPEGAGVELRWIDSGKNGAKLNAPKGLALGGDTLWVADIDTVRTFDRKTGNPTGETKVLGAKALNDVLVLPNGRVLVSDPEANVIFALDQEKKVSTYAKGAGLNGPNGLIAFGAGGGGEPTVWTVSYKSNELFSLDAKGAKATVIQMPKGGLDGIVLGREDYFVSSWDGSAIYEGRPGQTFAPVITDVKSPADITFDRQRNRLIVPLMQEDEIRAYDLK